MHRGQFPKRAEHPPPRGWDAGLSGVVQPIGTDGEGDSTSTVMLEHGAVACTGAEFNETAGAMPAPETTRFGKPMLRRQCTWGGTTYKFSGQTSADQGPLESAPVLVRRCVEDARGRVGRELRERLTGAHVNFYPNGQAGLGVHQDQQDSGVTDPIFSYTFIGDDEGVPPYRYFNVYTSKTMDVTLAAIPLVHGDLLVMAGAFQQKLWHHVPLCSRAAFGRQRRINVTVRAWGGASGVRDV